MGARLVRAMVLVNAAVECALVPIVLFFFSNVFLAVLSRYVFGTAIVTSIELTRLSFIWAAFLGAAIAYHRFAHVRFTLLIEQMPRQLQAAILVAAHLAALVFAILMVREGAALVQQVWRTQFPTLGWSQGWLYLVLPVVGAIIAFNAAARVLIAMLVVARRAPADVAGEGEGG